MRINRLAPEWLYFKPRFHFPYLPRSDSSVFSAMTFWITALACLGSGLAGGWLLRRALDPIEHKLRSAQLRLEEAETALRDYKLQVTEHFKGTAERINRLTENYRDLHQHLSDGALVLCDTNDPAQQPPLLTSLGDTDHADAQVIARAPPLDYAAPKTVGPSRSNSDDFDLDRIIDD